MPLVRTRMYGQPVRTGWSATRPMPVTLGHGRSRRLRSMAMALRLTESFAGIGCYQIVRTGEAYFIRSPFESRMQPENCPGINPAGRSRQATARRPNSNINASTTSTMKISTRAAVPAIPATP
jgi:hypothetical protein